MFNFTSKEVAQRFALLLKAELDRREVVVVKCPVETLPESDVLQSYVYAGVPSAEISSLTLDELMERYLFIESVKLGELIAGVSKNIFTMILPLPRGAWSTFERLGELGFRLTEGYDINSDKTIIRVDVLYAKV